MCAIYTGTYLNNCWVSIVMLIFSLWKRVDNQIVATSQFSFRKSRSFAEKIWEAEGHYEPWGMTTCKYNNFPWRSPVWWANNEYGVWLALGTVNVLLDLVSTISMTCGCGYLDTTWVTRILHQDVWEVVGYVILSVPRLKSHKWMHSKNPTVRRAMFILFFRFSTCFVSK